MTYAITSSCIGCLRCVSACPNGAISQAGTQLKIDQNRCNHCAGSFSVPQCWAICPTNNGCVAAIAPTTTDYWESWFATYTRLVQRLEKSSKPKYWNAWFERYADTVAALQNP